MIYHFLVASPSCWSRDAPGRGMRRVRDFQCGLQSRALMGPRTAKYEEARRKIYHFRLRRRFAGRRIQLAAAFTVYATFNVVCRTML